MPKLEEIKGVGNKSFREMYTRRRLKPKDQIEVYCKDEDLNKIPIRFSASYLFANPELARMYMGNWKVNNVKTV